MKLRLLERHHPDPRLPARRRQKKRLWTRPERQFLENRSFQIFSRKKNQLQPGDVLGGRFEILQVLGEGGMGTVYKAADREVDHVVALKLIHPDLAAHPAILARFVQSH